MIERLSIQQCYTAGYDHGWSCASWTDMPAIGTELPRHVDWVGVGEIESVEDQVEAWGMLVGSSCENSRQFSPFEFIAAAINAREEQTGEGEAERGWAAFERGERAAIAKYRRRHHPIRELRAAARELEDEARSEK